MTKKKAKKAKANPTQAQLKTEVKGGEPPRVSRRQQRADEQVRAAKMRQLQIVGGVMIVVLVIAVIAFWRGAGVVPVAELIATTGPNLQGAADAPVRIVEFGDFGCPSCRAWHNAGIKAQLQADFGDQLAFEFRHFPVITAQSPKAAEAGQCSAEQDSFWAYHDYIYENTPQSALAVADLKTYATVIGLDQETFDVCLDSGKYRDFVVAEQRAAVDFGARGTPSFFIDGQAISFSYQSMAAAIQATLDG